jgi:hypothetical protein
MTGFGVKECERWRESCLLVVCHPIFDNLAAARSAIKRAGSFCSHEQASISVQIVPTPSLEAN